MSERWEFSIDNQVWTSDGRKVAKAATREQAILISSAPDLLDACKFVMKYHEMHLERADDSELPFQLTDAVQKAISKAEGKL